MRRAVGVLAALVLLGGVTYALVPGDDPGGGDPVTVSGLIGSEKRDFFQDQRVVDELARQGLKVNAESIGSWLMDGDAKDFAFPASQPPADKLRQEWGIKEVPVQPFYSPLVILAHRPVADVLKQNDLATLDQATGLWTFRMDAYVAALKAGRTWSDLKGSAEHAELRGPVFLTTTDPESSSSGALHIALLSYLANNRQVVFDQSGIDATKDLLRTATAVQGGQKSSSDEPFKAFLAGVGSPLVLAYESQAAAMVLKGEQTGDMVVLYPDTTIYTDHTIVGRTAAGRKLAAQLHDNAELRRLEAQYGFRPQDDPDAFAALVKGRSPALAPNLAAAKVNQPPVPVPDVLTRLIKAAKGKAQ
ncbi:hypothetical protein ACFYUY_06790 [Kitasatospora sp. NPDC004745]|uniref:hypothetical protein n=1 Tax=unclassified Kitasatospora TaxID=2633591 RepID=UPI0033C8FFFB